MVIYEYANRLAQRGHTITLVYPRRLSINNSAGQTWSISWMRNHFTYFRRSIANTRPKWFDLDSRIQLMSIREPFAADIPDADIVVATSWYIAEYVLRYPENKGVKVNLIQGNEMIEGKYPHERVLATWTAPITKIVVSKWLLELGVRIGASNVQYIPNGVDFDVFRTRSPLEERPLRVAAAYSPKQIKDPETAIQALELVKRVFPDLRAVLFSAARKNRRLPSWIEYLRDPPKTTIVNDIYNGSAVYMCSSFAEGFGLPPAEAMACGCAVASTDCGGVNDYAQHGRNALISPVQDPVSLASNLCILLGDPDYRIELARSAQQDIKNFDWSISTTKMENLFAGLI